MEKQPKKQRKPLKPGDVFGRLTLIEKNRIGKTSYRWLCRCECGNIKSIWSSAILSGSTKSCGCIREEKRNPEKNYPYRQNTNSRVTDWRIRAGISKHRWPVGYYDMEEVGKYVLKKYFQTFFNNYEEECLTKLSEIIRDARARKDKMGQIKFKQYVFTRIGNFAKHFGYKPKLEPDDSDLGRLPETTECQCRAYAETTGRQCRRTAVPGKKFCYLHKDGALSFGAKV